MATFNDLLKVNNQNGTTSNTGGFLASKLKQRVTAIPAKESTTSKVLGFGGEILKSIAKLPLRAATNIDQGLSGTNREIYSGKTFGSVTPIGGQSIGIGENGKVTFDKNKVFEDTKDIAGASLETLSYLPFVGAAKTGFNTGRVALGQLAKEGAVGGATGVAGQQMQQGGEFDLGNILKGTAFGAVAGPTFGLTGSGISKIFGGKKAGEVIAEDVLQQAPSVVSKPVTQGINPTEIPNTINSIISDGKAAPELFQQVNTFTPKLSTELEASAIEKKFVEKFGDLPQVQTMNMKDESLKWADLVEKDYNAAKASVLNSQLPEGFNNSLGLGYEAVVRKATNEGDWQLLKELATNPNAAPTQASLTAQKLKSFDNNLIDSTDPIELMQSLSKARESVVDIKQKGVKKADVQTLDNATKPKIVKEDWDSFINNIPDC
jgi:hypothetical protein